MSEKYLGKLLKPAVNAEEAVLLVGLLHRIPKNAPRRFEAIASMANKTFAQYVDIGTL